MTHFGIIGYPLHHSFSANYFNEKFQREGIEAEYSLYPIDDISLFPALQAEKKLRGINVTMPYKQQIIQLLTSLDDTAKAIGAVNVIDARPDGQLIGYNTDAIGFIESIRPLLQPSDRHALILGTGGASKAVQYGLQLLGLTTIKASRTPQADQIAYSDIRLQDYQVIVNCTPLGMVPDTENMPPLHYEQLNAAQLLYDCIYNPEETQFLKAGKQHGCRCKNGIDMLYGQAIAAWQIWNK